MGSRAAHVAMVETKALPSQDGLLMSQGDEVEFQRLATTPPERELENRGYREA